MQYGYDPQCVTGDVTCPTPPKGAHSASRGGGATLGVILIVMGVAFLVAQMVPGLDWWNLWPLVIVIAGVAQAVTPSIAHGWGVERIADGIGTVLFGLLLLGNTTGYISWHVWLTLLSLWPVLLISGGLGLLAKASGQEWMRALAAIPVWVTLLYAAGLWWTGAPLPLEFAPLPQDLLSLPFIDFQ